MEMAKWVGELSTESSRVRIGVEARRFIDYSNQQCESVKRRHLKFQAKREKRKKKKKKSD